MSWPNFSDSSEKGPSAISAGSPAHFKICPKWMITSVFAFFCLWTRFFIRDNNDHSSTEGNTYLIWLPVLELDRPAVCSVSEKGITKKYFMRLPSFLLSMSRILGLIAESSLYLLWTPPPSFSLGFSASSTSTLSRYEIVKCPPLCLLPCFRLNVRKEYRRWIFSWNQLWYICFLGV